MKSEICPRSKTPVELWFVLTVAQWSGSNVAVDITFLVLVCSTALIIRNGVIWKRQSVSVSIKDIKVLYPNFFIRQSQAKTIIAKMFYCLILAAAWIFLGNLFFAPIQRKGNDVHFLRLFFQGPVAMRRKCIKFPTEWPRSMKKERYTNSSARKEPSYLDPLLCTVTDTNGMILLPLV